jgi:hypothetical protein
VRVTSLLLVLAVLLAACGGGSDDEAAQSGLSDLTGVDELKTRFNDDRGEARLVLLLSPT